MDQMTSNQPYLLRAFCDWIVDNGLTPYIVVDALLPGVEVPTQFVKDGQIVLNISPSACVNLNVDLEGVSFQARFSGQPMQVFVPSIAISAIYARENGAGTVFTHTPEELAEFEKSMDQVVSVPPVSKLTSVEKSTSTPTEAKIKTVIENTELPNDEAKKSEKDSSSKAKRPTLKIIK